MMQFYSPNYQANSYDVNQHMSNINSGNIGNNVGNSNSNYSYPPAMGFIPGGQPPNQGQQFRPNPFLPSSNQLSNNIPSNQLSNNIPSNQLSNPSSNQPHNNMPQNNTAFTPPQQILPQNNNNNNF